MHAGKNRKHLSFWLQTGNACFLNTSCPACLSTACTWPRDMPAPHAALQGPNWADSPSSGHTQSHEEVSYYTELFSLGIHSLDSLSTRLLMPEVSNQIEPGKSINHRTGVGWWSLFSFPKAVYRIDTWHLETSNSVMQSFLPNAYPLFQ